MRNQILKAATRLFAAHGFDGTSLKDISEAVGIRKPSLLYHYESKEKLRLAVLKSILDRWQEVLPRLLEATAGGEPRFETIIQETVTFFTVDPDRARLLVREILDRPEDMRARLREYVRPWVGVVADYIRKGQKHGQVHADVDPEAYVVHVINLLVAGLAVATSMSGAILPEASDHGVPGDRHVREVIRIAHRSLFTSKPQPAQRPAQPPARQPAQPPARQPAPQADHPHAPSAEETP